MAAPPVHTFPSSLLTQIHPHPDSHSTSGTRILQDSRLPFSPLSFVRPVSQSDLSGPPMTGNSKISSALADDYDKDEESEPAIKEPASKIVTTEDEIESFYIIRGLLAGIVPVEDIVHRDTESYFGILYKDNNRKPICRLNLDARNKQLLIPDANKKFERIYIDSLNDLYKYKNRLIEVVKRYM